MPATYGGGIGQLTRREPTRAPSVPARPTPLGPPHPAPQVFRPTFSSQPFAPAQHQAQQRVVQAQRSLPKMPTPYIPRLSNPTPHQTQAALTLIREHQRQQLAGRNAAGIRAYQQELANDPRQRQFLETVRHYAQASEAHLRRLGGLGGGVHAEARPVAAGGSQGGPVGWLERLLAPGAAAIPGLGPAAVANPTVEKIVGTAGKKGVAVGTALAEDPIGTLRHTATSVPGTLNAMVTGTARLAAEAGPEGKPGAALEQFLKAFSTDINRRYGTLNGSGGVSADAKRMEREGILPELLDASLLVGGPGAAAGRAASKLVEATGYGAEDAARLAASREARLQALQAPHPASPAVPAPTRAQAIRGTVYNAATRQRANLRVAPGNEAPSVTPGSAVKVQPASENLFRGVAQQAIDNARRARSEKGLAALKTADVFTGPPKPALQALAPLLKPGEVAPLIQKGGHSWFPGAAFAGAGKEQRIGTSALKGAAVEMRRGEATTLQRDFASKLRAATPEQRAMLVHAKEGLLPTTNPDRAVEALKEIRDQALEGSRDAQGRNLIPLKDRVTGADVAAKAQRVLDHVEKHGVDSVFNHDFHELVQSLPDERLTAHRDPTVSQDALISRRYRPQVQHLEQWAARHPDHPLAPATRDAVAQIHQLEEEGGALRAGREGADMPAQARHQLASDKYATAHNLSQELAQMHGLTQTPSYVEHTKRFTESNMVHTVGNQAPRLQHQMRGILQAKGYRSTDPQLILNGMLKNVRNDYKFKYLQPWHERFNAAPPELTTHEATEWMHEHLNSEHFRVAHLGKLQQSLAETLGMEHAQHFNLDAEAQATHHTNMLDAVLGTNIPREDATKGAGVYPVAALNELKGVFANPGLPGRVAGKLKASVSALMLGTSLPWLATMSGVTYPLQSLYSGAGLVALREAVSHYRSLGAADKQAWDRWFGVDNPFELSSHGITSERIGSRAPKGFEELSRITHLANNHPFVRMLARQRPDHIILRMERVPRRYARINAAYKGVKVQALREMLAHAHGAAAAQSKIELLLKRMEYAGRRAPEEFVKQALENRSFMEAHAERLNKLMGEWKRTTQFERNVVGRMVLFYPWLRYSLRLAAHTLPHDHPLLYSLGLKYGTTQHAYLKELLGTEPTPGDVYLGPEQPNVPAAQRKFGVIGVRQANPLLNTVSDLLGAQSPTQVLDILPPYAADGLEYFAGKNLFTGRPFKGADKGEPEYKNGGLPNVLNYTLNRALGTFSPGRTAMKIAAKGMPQSEESLPWAPKPVQYSPKTLNKIRQEAAKAHEGGVGQQLFSELLPLLPHPDEGRLQGKLRVEEKQAKEAQAKARKEHRAPAAATGSDPAMRAREEILNARGAPSGGSDPAMRAREEILAARERVAAGR